MDKKFNTKCFIKTLAVMIVLMVTSMFLVELNAQKKDNGDTLDTLKSTKNEPKVTIKVNKKKDSNGNITQYDSTYISSWSNDNSMMMPTNVDSLVKVMHERFFKDFRFGNMDSLARPYGFNFQFNDSLGAFNDSTFFNHHFNDMFGDNFGDFDKLMREHQKMMQQFFNQQKMFKMPDNVMPPAAPSQPQIPQKKDNSLKKEKVIDHNGYQVNT